LCYRLFPVEETAHLYNMVKLRCLSHVKDGMSHTVLCTVQGMLLRVTMRETLCMRVSFLTIWRIDCVQTYYIN
jgi:hypothetical protein